MMDDVPTKRKPVWRKPSAWRDDSIREALKDIADPTEMAEALVAIVRDPTASNRDRLLALKQIADRRDGLPVAVVINATVNHERLLRDVPEAALDQIEGILRAQLALGPGDDMDPERDEESESPDA